MNRFLFYKPFNTVWERLKQKKSLIISSFSHCGLWPTGNPCKDDDFPLNQMFVLDDKSRSQSKSPMSVFIQSPKKNPNSVHFKEHTAIDCNEENLKRKRSADKQQTRQKISKKPKLDRSQNSSLSCTICNNSYALSVLEWYKCSTTYQNWCCEECLGDKECRNCL